MHIRIATDNTIHRTTFTLVIANLLLILANIIIDAREETIAAQVDSRRSRSTNFSDFCHRSIALSGRSGGGLLLGKFRLINTALINLRKSKRIRLWMACALPCRTSTLDSEDDVAANLLLPGSGIITCALVCRKGRVDGSELVLVRTLFR